MNKKPENGNGFRQLVFGVVTGLFIIGIAASITLSITISSRIMAVETSITSFEKRISKMESDIYTPRFAQNKAASNQAKATPVNTPRPEGRGF